MNLITQDAQKTGAGIRTIALRIAGTEEAKQTLQDMNEDVSDFVVQTQSKTRDIIKDYTAVASNAYQGVDVLDSNGNLRSTYEILQDIADVYKEIQEEDKKYGTNRAQALVEQLAGKNRSNIAASILSAPEMMRSAYEESQNATGSAMEENDKYLQSIAAHQAQFTNAVQELINDLIDSGTINAFIDAGTKIVNIIDAITKKTSGLTGIVTGLIATVMTFANKGDLNGLFKINLNANRSKGEKVISSELGGMLFGGLKPTTESEETIKQDVKEASADEALAAAKEQVAQAAQDVAAAENVQQEESKQTTAQNIKETVSEDKYSAPDKDKANYSLFNVDDQNKELYKKVDDEEHAFKERQKIYKQEEEAERACNEALYNSVDLEIDAYNERQKVLQKYGSMENKEFYDRMNNLKREKAEWVEEQKRLYEQLNPDDLTYCVPDSIPNDLLPANSQEDRMKNGLADIIANAGSTDIENQAQGLLAQLEASGKATDEVKEKYDVLAKSIIGENAEMFSSAQQVTQGTADSADKSIKRTAAAFSGLSDKFKFGIKQLGSALLSGIANFGIGLLIGAAVQGLGYLIDKLVVTKEEAKEAGAAVKSAIETSNKSITTGRETVSQYGERFVELSNGVNQFGENISLSDENYNEYLSISEKLAETFPELVSGYNSLNEPILTNIKNIEQMNEALDEQALKAAKQFVFGKNEEKEDNATAIFDSFQKNTNYAEQSALNDFLKDRESGINDIIAFSKGEMQGNMSKDFQRLLASLQGQGTVLTDMVKMRRYSELREKNNNGSITKEEKDEWDALSKEVEKAIAEVETYNEKLKGSNDIQAQQVQEWAKQAAVIAASEKDLSDEQSTMLANFAGNLSGEFLSSFTGDPEEVSDDVRSLVDAVADSIKNGNQDVQDAWSGLFNIDEETANMSQEKYVEFVQNAIDTIVAELKAQGYEIDGDTIKVMLNGIIPHVDKSSFNTANRNFADSVLDENDFETGVESEKASTGGTYNVSTILSHTLGKRNDWQTIENYTSDERDVLNEQIALRQKELQATKDETEAQKIMNEALDATADAIKKQANAVDDADSAIDSFYDTNKAVFDEIGVGQDDFKKYVKNLQKTDKELADNTEEALALALANEKLSYAFTDLNDNLETYQKLSKETSATKKQTPEWQGQMGQAATDLQMISGVSFNTDQTQKFLQDADNVTLLKEAINGTEGALDSLYQKIIQYEGDEISSEVQNSLRAIMPELDTSTFEGEYNQFVAWIAQHRDIGNLTATADFNALPFIQHINNAVSSAQIGAQQMKDALKALEGVGVATEVTTETKYIPNVQKQLWQQYDFANKKFTKDIVSYSAGSPAYFKSDSVPIQVPKLTFKNLNSSGYSSKAPSGSGLYKSKSGGSGGGSGSKEKEPYSEDIDWIERASKKLTDNLHDIQGVVDDTFTNWDGRLQHVAKEYENLTAQMGLAQKAREYYLKKANAVALPAEYKKKVLNGEINVETIRDENLKKLIEDYQSFWDKYVQYEQQFYDLSRERMAMLSKEIDMISQRWDDKISDVEHSSAMADLDVNTGDITGQLPALNKQRANAIQEISLVEQERAAIAKKMAAANVSHDSEEYQKWKKQLQKLDEKVVSLKENLQDIAKQKFDAINNQFEFLANQIDHANNRMQSLSDIATAMGYYASNEFIKTEKKVAEVNYANASARRDELQRSLNEAVANGAVKEGSDAWIEMKNAIEDATDSVFQYTAAIEQAKQKLRQWDWDAQDYINERTQRIFDTNQFFIDQLEQSKMFADNGGFIDRSNAQQGLHVSQYSIYLAEAKKYAEAIQDINDQLASDPYDIELIARRETLIDQQREMIKGAKSEKEAIRDLVKNSYDTFLDYLQMLIDKRKEALEAEQDLFEYEKNIREQTKQIASYQKQLSSIKADNSEENRLRIQQLTNSLTDAQEQLQETEHDRWRTDQEALMDQMYNSFEELINTRLDDIDGVLHEAIQRTTENTANIVATIQAEANRIGVDVSSSLNVLYTLDNTLNTQFGTLADDIANHTSTLVDNLDSQGQAIVDAGNRAAMTVTGDGHTTLADINNMLNNILAAIGRLQANINNYGYGSGGSSGGSRPSSSSSSSSSTVKGYRLYNPNGGGGQHLFTTSAAERDRLIKAGWREEAGSGFSTSGTAIQRYYNPNNGDHMYTINPTEQSTLKNAGWKYEGVAGYASGSGKTTYRLLNPNTGTHTFTSNPAEVAKLVAAGWKKEGTAWKDAAFAQGGTIGKAIKRTGEDGIILARTGEEVLSLDKIEGMKQVLAMFEPLAKMQQSAPNVKSTIGGSNVTVGDITTTLSLPNVENYEQFVEKAKADPRFEKLVQQMTLGNALGQSSLKKFNL